MRTRPLVTAPKTIARNGRSERQPGGTREPADGVAADAEQDEDAGGDEGDPGEGLGVVGVGGDGEDRRGDHHGGEAQPRPRASRRAGESAEPPRPGARAARGCSCCGRPGPRRAGARAIRSGAKAARRRWPRRISSPRSSVSETTRCRSSAMTAGSGSGTSRAASPATLGDRPEGPGDHRDAEGERLDQRDAEALVLGQAEEHVGRGEATRELVGLQFRSRCSPRPARGGRPTPGAWRRNRR